MSSKRKQVESSESDSTETETTKRLRAELLAVQTQLSESEHKYRLLEKSVAAKTAAAVAKNVASENSDKTLNAVAPAAATMPKKTVVLQRHLHPSTSTFLYPFEVRCLVAHAALFLSLTRCIESLSL